jgi:LmbE family N-acetylglucosaminyl deacetylase
MATLLVLALPSSWNNDPGTHPPIFVDSRDHERSTAACETLTHDVWRVMVAVQPEAVLTFGPTGLSGHEDHTTIHCVTTAAFHRSRPTAVMAPRLYDSPCHPRVPRQPVLGSHPQGVCDAPAQR